MFDLILKNGVIVDGTGNPWYRGDVAVRDRKIAAVGRLAAKAARIIDVDGRVVAPGFIDIHTHSDLPVLANPRAESKIRQGVTTEVVGNCGNSAAPLAGDAVAEFAERADALGFKLTWRTVGEYLDTVAARGTAVNIAPLIGHSTVRKSVVGYGDRDATAREIQAMREMVAAAMADGAFGMSSGLIYPPGCFTKTAELIALGETVRAGGGYYASHIRNEGAGVADAAREHIEIGERSGVALEWSHIKAAGGVMRGKAAELLQLMDGARERGIDITADIYPYEATSTGLSMFLPKWAHAGGRAELVRRLRDPEISRRMYDELTARARERGTWEKILISSVESNKNKDLAGMTVGQIADRQGKEPVAVIIDLLAEEEGSVQMVSFAMWEEDIQCLLRHPAVMIGSDGATLAPYGILDNGKPHPRNYGTFPRVLRKYVREEKTLRLEDAVRKMTLLPARRLGIGDRGLLAPGMWADITVFDPATVYDVGTYIDPKRYPAGIDYVLVNGQVAVEQGEHTGAMAGRALRRPA
ncbi:MAG: N-acyl-D-amino-acid deacylase family protein [bacterium]|jgi:N-acyl-D-amino-acid deacylase